MRTNLKTSSKDIGKTLLEIIIENGYTLSAPCGGKGVCGNCKVKATGNLSSLSEKENELLTKDELENNIRISCLTKALGEAEIFLEDSAFDVLTGGELALDTLSPAADLSLSENPVGISIDIGTTTVALSFFSLKDGTLLFEKGIVNPQRAFGADVISRIEYVTNNPDGLSKLQTILVEALNDVIDEFCQIKGFERSNIIDVTIAANSTMELIFAKISPASLGHAPFTLASNLGENIPAVDIGLNINKKAQIYFMPLISGFIGGDTVAVMLYLDFDKRNDCAFVVDIGTNGEMALTKNNEIFACSTAAGPAFEGAKIKFGTGSITGAITDVALNNGISLKTIGNAKPSGICGSGLIALTSELLKNEIIEDTGLLSDESEYSGEEDNETVFYLTEDKKLYITQRDVREIQLAKAAFFAGTDTLMTYQTILMPLTLQADLEWLLI